jgi:hypothetical protein
VQAFASQYSVDTAKVLAFTSWSMIPALVFFSLFECRIVGGLTGAVKAELPAQPASGPEPGRTWDHARPAWCQLDAFGEDCDQGGTQSNRSTGYRRCADDEVEEES